VRGHRPEPPTRRGITVVSTVSEGDLMRGNDTVPGARRLIPIAFLGFVVLGMPRAAESVAWPSMADDLGQTLGALGWLITAHIGGYFVAAVANGVVTRRLGTGRVLVTSGVVASIALVGYGATTGWWMLLVAAVVLGIGAGMIDAAMNAYVALNHSTRVMGLLHASFGLGATLGPLIMTWLITDGAARWRLGFLILAGTQLTVTLAFWSTRTRWGATEPLPRSSQRPAGVMPLLLGFFLVSGIEGATGTWAYVYFTEGLAMAERPAGLLVTGFFAAYTAARVTMGLAGDRIATSSYLRFGKSATLIGVGLMAWNPTTAVSAAGLLIAGMGMALLFPIMMLVTPALVGTDHAHDVVGYELGAATLGMAGIPAAIGLAVDAFDVGTIPPILTAVAVALVLVVPSHGRRRRREVSRESEHA
jgi:fucose permease